MQTKESAFTKERKLVTGNMIIMIILCAGVAWLVLRACAANTSSTIELPSVSQPAAPVAEPSTQQYCIDGKCVKVTMCTAINEDCGSIEPGPKADYGTGYHVSADGGTRPNPPKGWKWAGK